MSIVLGDGLREANRDPETVVQSYPGYGLVAIQAGEARAQEQRILRSPDPDEPAHGDVWGEKPGRVQRQLAKCAQWIVQP